MASQWASRLAFRHLHVGNALSRPSRVIELQNQLRQLSLASTPRFAAPLARQLSRASSQQTQSFSTESDSAKPKRTTKTTKTKTASTKRKSSTSTKKEPTEAQKERLAKREEATKEKKAKQAKRAEAQKERKAKRAEVDHRKHIRAAALEEPKKLAETTWHLAVQQEYQETRGQHEGPTAKLTAAVQVVREQGADALKEKYQAQAEKNRETNEAAYEAWVKSHTPLQIKEANKARRQMMRLGLTKKKLPMIKDDRQLKHPSSAFFLYSQQRVASGDMKHMAIPDIQVQMSREWKELTEQEQAPFIKQATELREKYYRDHVEIYGVKAATARRNELKELKAQKGQQ